MLRDLAHLFRRPYSFATMLRQPKRRPFARIRSRLRLEELEDRTLLSGDTLLITAQPPSTVLTGSPFSIAVQVDTAAGTVDTTYTGTISVAIAAGTGDPGASLGGTTTFIIDNGTGVAEFPNLIVQQGQSILSASPTSYTLQVSGDNLPSTLSDDFDVSTLVVTSIAYAPQGGANASVSGVNFTYTVSGAPLPQAVPVTLYWASGASFSSQAVALSPGANDSWATIPAGTAAQTTPYTQNVPSIGNLFTGSPDNTQDLLVVLGSPYSSGFDPAVDVQAMSLNLAANNAIPPVYQSNASYALLNMTPQPWGGPTPAVPGQSAAIPGVTLGFSPHQTTISAGGCLLVSLDMALNYAGVATDPLALNNELLSSAVGPDTPGYFPMSGNVNPGPATKIAGDAAGLPNLGFFTPTSPVTTTQQLRDLLTSTGEPIIVKVNNPGFSGTYTSNTFTAVTTKGSATIDVVGSLPNLQVGDLITGPDLPNGGAFVVSINSFYNSIEISANATATDLFAPITYGSTHFVLVTGLAPGNTFYINDPGYAGRKTLADPAYNNQFVSVLGYVKDPPDDSELYIASGSADDAVDLSVTNAQGQSTGVAAPGSSPADQIPNSYYFDEGPVEGSADTTSVQLVYVSQPGTENYTIASTGSGDYTLATDGDSASGQPTADTVFTASASSLEPNDVTADSADGQITFPQQTPEVNLAANNAVYNGSPDAATATITDANGNTGSTLEGVGLQLTYYTGTTVSGTGTTTAPTAAGTYTVVASFPGSTDYTSASDQATFTISPPSITVPLQQALSAFDNAVGTIDQDGVGSIISQALGMNGNTLPVVDVTLDGALDLSQDLLAPFQNSLNLSGPDWQSVAAELQNAGFSIPLAFTGTPDAHGNLFEVTWSQTLNLPSVPLLVSGNTGFSYLDGAGGGIFGALNGSGQVAVSLTFGVDINAQKQIGFFIAPSNSVIQATLTGSTASDGLTGSLAIGDLASVNATATGSVNITGTLGLKPSATDTDGKIRLADLTKSLGQAVTGGVNGSVQLNANFDAQLPSLPDIQWTGTFGDAIQNSVLQSPTVSLQEPSVSSLLSSLGASLFSLGDGIPILGPLSSTLNQPLPLINESISQLTGLNSKLPTLPSLPSGFSNLLAGSYPVAGGTLTLNVTPATIDQFLHGQTVNLVSWQASGDESLINEDLTIPIFSLGVPDIASVELDATFGLHASLTYDIGFGLDGHGFWMRAGTPSDPTLGMSFAVTAGVQGQVEVFGIPLAEAGGNIGFSVTPYVTLTADPYDPADVADPNNPKVYLSDLAVFGSNPLSDIADDLSVGIQGAFTGEVYASINLFLFSLSWSWGISIPVFNYERAPNWPAAAGAAGPGGPWAQHVSENGGVLTFTGTPGSDILSLTGGTDGSVTINWAGVGSQTYTGVNEFVFNGDGGNDRLTTAPNFAIPIQATSSGNDYLQGGAGNDTLIGGTGNDTLVAGTGNDCILGGSGTDLLIGGVGNDTIVCGRGTDSVFGGSGNSTLDGGIGKDSIYAGSGDDLIQGTSGTYLIDGGSGSDTINAGTGANDSIYGGAGGHNVITGSSGGYNLIYGGGPGDTINGGAGGNDTIYGSAGTFPGAVTNNVISGGAKGNNLIFGGGGGDALYGMSGNNTIYGGNGNETLYGGDGQNLVFNPLSNGLSDPAGDPNNPSSGSNLLIGGSGNDVMYGDSTGNNTLQAGPGNDTLFAGTGADFLEAGPGTDAMYGGGGGVTFQLPFTPIGQPQPQDTLVGGAGINTLLLRPPASGSPGTSDPIVNGNPEQPTPGDYEINFTTVPGSRNQYQATLSNLDTGAAIGQLTVNLPPDIANIDLAGGPGNNWIQVDPSVTRNLYLYGGPGHNTLMAGSGNDTTGGASGSDTLVAGPGTAVLYGGAGDDILYGGDGPTQDAPPDLSKYGTATPITTTEGHDTLIAGPGDDELYAGTGGDVLIGGSVARQVGANGTLGLATLQNGQYQLIDGAGRDVLVGGTNPAEPDLLIAGPGSPGAFMKAGAGNDVLVADNDGSNILQGGPGNDTLIGGNLDNNLIGGAGNATLVGGLGLNTIIGGSGADSTYALYASYNAAAWTQAEQTATADGVHLVPPPSFFQSDDPGTSSDTIDNLLMAQQNGPLTATQQSDLDSALLTEFNSLSATFETLSSEISDLASQGPLSPAQQQELKNLGNQLEDNIAAIGAVVGPLTGANLFVDSLIGGAGNEQFYGNPTQATYMGGGSGNDSFYDYNGNDTVLGGTGSENAIVFQGDGNFNLQPITINGGQQAAVDVVTQSQTANLSGNTITGADTAGLEPGEFVTGPAGLIPDGTLIYSINSDGSITLTNNATSDATGVALNFGWVVSDNLGINTVGVHLGSGNDTVTAGNFQSAAPNLEVQCGTANDTVDASLFPDKETLSGGSGNDVIKIGANIATGSLFQGGTGNNELDIEDPAGGSVTVGGTSAAPTLQVGAYSESMQGFQTFQKLVVVGTSGPDSFTTNGAISNVVLEGGSGTNTLSAGPGTAELIGGTGPNTFVLNGQGNYTVVGGSGGNNVLTFNSNDTANGDSLSLSQSNSTITMTGTVNGSSVSLAATNMTSLFINTGTGSDDAINASGMTLGVTLNMNGGGSNDTLIGGAGNNTLYYSGPNGTYSGGGGTDNMLVFQDPDEGDTVYFFAKSLRFYDSATERFYPIGSLTNIEYYQVPDNPTIVEPVEQEDGTFNLSNYSSLVLAESYSHSNSAYSASFANYQIGSGDPGPSLEQQETVNSSVGDIYSGTLYLPYTYNPSLPGAPTVSSISVDYDAILYNSSGTSLSYAIWPLIEQAGVYYQADNGATGLTDNWTHFSFEDYTSSQFYEANQGGTSGNNGANTSVHPDFSSSGAPITFGFEAGEFLENGGGIDFGIDNLAFAVNTSWSPQTLIPVDDIPITNVVLGNHAGFTDANPNAEVSTESVTINWGDGSSSPGTVGSLGGGNFNYSASHFYAAVGTYPVNVAIVDSLGTATTVGTTFMGGLALNNGILDNYTGSTPTVIDSGDNGVESYLVRNAGSNSTIFSLHNPAPAQSGGDLYASTGATATPVFTNVQSMFLGPDNNLYVLQSGGSLYVVAPDATSPAFYASNVQNLVRDASGNLYQLDTDGFLYELASGSGWALIDDNVRSISDLPEAAPGPVLLNDNFQTYSSGNLSGQDGWFGNDVPVQQGIVNEQVIPVDGNGNPIQAFQASSQNFTVPADTAQLVLTYGAFAFSSTTSSRYALE